MTSLNFAIGLALVSVAVILIGAPDWVVAVLLGLFALAAFFTLSTVGDIEDVGEGSEG